MEWINRGGPQPPTPPAAHGSSHKRNKFSLLSLRTATVALLFAGTVLIIALVGYVMVGGPSSESKYVDSNKLQAVFLTGGQVYFGHVRNLNDDYLRLTDIYYLRVNQQVQPDQATTKQQASTPVLVPLGCELHRPQNEMLINRDQVIFWENLKDNQPENTVPGAVKKFLADNPNGQKCATTDSTTNKSTSTTP